MFGVSGVIVRFMGAENVQGELVTLKTTGLGVTDAFL